MEEKKNGTNRAMKYALYLSYLTLNLLLAFLLSSSLLALTLSNKTIESQVSNSLATIFGLGMLVSIITLAYLTLSEKSRRKEK